MSIKFDLTDANLSELVSNAILEQMDGEMRALVIKQAIVYLTEPDKSGRGYYGTKESPLQEAFNHAVSIYANQVVQKFVAESPDVRTAIEQVLQDSVQTLITKDDAFRKIVTDALLNAMNDLRRRADD